MVTIQKTQLGLPYLNEITYKEYRNEVGRLRNPNEARIFYEGLLSKIKCADSLYAKFIDDAVAIYPNEDKDVAWAELIGGYELLAKEGKLSKLEEDRFKRQWEATMNRTVAILNVGANMDLILADNPVYWQFIMDSTGYFPQEQRVNIMSDLSCGYMFLVNSLRADP